MATAETVVAEADEAEVEDPVVALQRVESVYETGRHDEAIPVYKRAVELNPGRAQAYSYLAATYAALGLFDQADAWLRRREANASGEYFSGFSTCWEGWKVNSVRGDRAALAQNVDTLLARASAENPLPWSCAARLERYLGRHGEAKTHLERFIDEAEPGRLPLVELAFLSVQAGEEERAEALLAESEARAREEMIANPEDDGPYLTLAEVAAIRGNQDRAVEHLREAVDRGADRRDWELYYRLSGETLGDPIFESLRGHSEFEQMMAEIRAELDRMRERVVQADH